MTDIFGGLDVDLTDIVNTILGVQTELEAADEAADELEEKASKVIRKVVMGARAGWGILQGLIRVSGGTISMTERLVASAIIGGVQTLVPLLVAAKAGGIASLNPVQVAAAGMGLLEVGAALTALAQYNAGMSEESRQMRGMNFVFSNLSNMLSSFSF